MRSRAHVEGLAMVGGGTCTPLEYTWEEWAGTNAIDQFSLSSFFSGGKGLAAQSSEKN